MNTKEAPFSRFLLPAGLLPPLVTLVHFHQYHNLLSGKFSGTGPIAGGFEYYYMVGQDPMAINHSLIGGKIRGVHGPWTGLDQSKMWRWKILAPIIIRPKVGDGLTESASQTLHFAEAIGAEYVIFHALDLEPGDPDKTFGEISTLAKRLKITVYLENDGAETARDLASPSDRWIYNPTDLWQRFRCPIVFDPATIEINGQNIAAAWQNLLRLRSGKIQEVIGHVHLNEYQPQLRLDQGKLRSKRYSDLLQLIAASDYRGNFTFEVSPLQSQTDHVIAGLYTAAALIGLVKLFPRIASTYARVAQKNLWESIQFAAAHLSQPGGKELAGVVAYPDPG